jgi:hypothetical protein
MAQRERAEMSSKEVSRRTEKERREMALQQKGKVVSDSGHALGARKLDQMVSLRLDPEILQSLREIAEKSGAGLSDLIREAISDWLVARDQARFYLSYTSIETGSAIFGDVGAGSVTDSRVRESQPEDGDWFDAVLEPTSGPSAQQGVSRSDVVRPAKP